jgi:hypothetical protein
MEQEKANIEEAKEIKTTIAGILKKVKNGVSDTETEKELLKAIGLTLRLSELQFKYQKHLKEGGRKIQTFEGENPFTQAELKELKRDLAAARKAVREQK